MNLPGRFLSVLLISISLLQPASAQHGPWGVKECVDTALANNLNVLLALNTVELSKLGVQQSKNNLLPAFNASANQSLNVGRTLNPVSYQYGTGTTWNTNFGLTGTLNLFDGLQNLNAIKQSKINYQSAGYDLESVKYDLSMNVVNDYLQVLYAGEAVKIAQQQINATQAQLDNTSHFVEAGKKTESDLLQLKSELATDRLTLVNAQSQFKTTSLNLQQLMNITVTDSFRVQYMDGIEPQPVALEDVNSIYQQTIAFQPIVKSYRLRTESAQYSIKMAQGAYYPQLMLKGNFGTNYSTASKHNSVSYIDNIRPIGYLQSNPSEIVMGDVPQSVASSSNYPFGDQLKDNLNSTFSIGVSIPILNYLQVRNNVKRQRINLASASLNERTTQINLRKNVEQAYTDVQNAEARFNAAKEGIDAVDASYKNAASKYDSGKMTATDLLLEKTKLIKAESDYLQAKYELLFRSKILDHLKGNTLTF